MRPIKITITAFIPFAEKQEIDFTKFKDEGLFLINGPMGSGKTSILDAMTFALYGTLPGMRGAKTLREGFHVKSDFAASDTAPEVVFEVEINSIEYRYTRKAEFQNPSNKTPTPGKALLEWKLNGKWESIASNAAEINSKSLEYLGLEVDQFAQLILLPQGQFAKFFQSNSKDRKEILMKLFSVDQFETIQTWFKDQKDEAEKAKAEAKATVHDLETRLKQITKNPEIEISNEAIDHFLASVLEKIQEIEPAKQELESVKDEIQSKMTLAQSGNEALKKFSEAKENRDRFQTELNRVIQAITDSGLKLRTGDEVQSFDEIISTLDSEKQEIDQHLTDFQRVEVINTSISTNKTERERLEKKAKTVQDALQSHNRELTANRELEKTTVVDEAKLPGLQKNLDSFSQAIKKFEDLDAKNIELGNLEAKVNAAADNLAEQKTILEKTEAEFRSNIAAYMASTLKTNEACSVCGSKEHPAPAVPSDHQPTQEILNDAKERFDKATESHNAAVTAQALLVADIQTQTDLLNAYKREELSQEVQRHGAEIEQTNDALKNLKELRNSIQTLESAVTKADKDQRDIADDLARLGERDSALNNELTELSTKISGLEKETLNLDNERITTEIDKVKKLKKDFEANSKSVETSRAIMNANEELSKNAVDNIDEIEAEFKTKNDAFIQMNSELTLLRNSEIETQAIKQEFAPASADLDRTEKLFRKWKDIEAYTSGTEGKKLDLVSYYLGYRLKQVLAVATNRLSAATDGRYRFEHDENVVGARGTKSGLAILVNDAYTGARRGPESLSGGETFIASLSLALGLADVVIAETGGKRLDSLFVDEGFGSLDTKTLNNVMDILENLRENGRMIGVVSHVESMKERIVPQINVEKTDKGSSISISGV